MTARTGNESKPRVHLVASLDGTELANCWHTAMDTRGYVADSALLLETGDGLLRLEATPTDGLTEVFEFRPADCNHKTTDVTVTLNGRIASVQSSCRVFR